MYAKAIVRVRASLKARLTSAPTIDAVAGAVVVCLKERAPTSGGGVVGVVVFKKMP